jgi:hypothetical protein
MVVEDRSAPIKPVPAGPRISATAFELIIFKNITTTDDPPIIEVEDKIDFLLLLKFCLKILRIFYFEKNKNSKILNFICY